MADTPHSEADAHNRSNMVAPAINEEELTDLLGEPEPEDHTSDDLFPDLPPYDESVDPDLADLNNPDVETFGEAPLIGVRSPRSPLFGQNAETIGRPSSPKLYSSAANFPTAVQFRVWRWENGIPVAMGAISCDASEDDFVRQFYDAMPKEGDGRFQFRFRPVDVNGRELGKEFTKNISEFHKTLQRINRQREREDKESSSRSHSNDPILINQGQDQSHFAEEMGRMFEQAVETSDRRAAMLEQSLEMERERLRDEEKSRYEERLQVADRSASVVQQMTEKMMATDKIRSKEQMDSQKQHSSMMMSTLTTVFSQQQAAAREQAERIRQQDEARARQDREYFERQKNDREARAVREAKEWERKRLLEKEEAERRLASEEKKLDLERTRIEQQRKYELEQLRIEAERRQQEADRRRETEREESRLKMEQQRIEMERQRNQMLADREQSRAEAEERRRAEQQEFERKLALMREESERKDRQERDRQERDKQDFQLRMERERQEREAAHLRRQEELKREELLREERARRDEDRRREDMQLRLKQIEADAERNREFQQRMAEQARLERESQREAMERRERQEREAKEAAERDRQRQHELQTRSMEMDKERDREHQERMMAIQNVGQGGSNLFGSLGEQLGLEPTEVLAKLFGADGEGSWSDAIPKMLGSLAEVGKAALTAKTEGGATVKGRRRVVTPQPGQIIQTPQGPMRVIDNRGALASEGLFSDGPASFSPSLQSAEPPSAPQPQPQQAEAPASEAKPQEAPAESAAAGSTDPATAFGPVSTLDRAKEAGIKLLKQKKARKAIRTLVDKMRDAEESDWMGLVTEAITAEVGIYYYLKAVTVMAALTEAGAEPDLQQRIIAAMKESGMTEDMPFDEKDYIQAKAATSTEDGDHT